MKTPRPRRKHTEVLGLDLKGPSQTLFSSTAYPCTNSPLSFILPHPEHDSVEHPQQAQPLRRADLTHHPTLFPPWWRGGKVRCNLINPQLRATRGLNPSKSLMDRVIITIQT